ncbi:hypothetical protein SAMN04487846_0256 [Microbacterium sp. cf046]|uniref:O-antigen ligase family protein n=1 Tax=Microbacterium sp. cf046 TaxID=1761803 RepID=UPI0008E1ABCF|nr:hypothetical protein [Microbacterium sp. cf046]SFR88495.1 hypothetical protein SAMN04487846_0256 [Microbacterium sp. cf046]
MTLLPSTEDTRDATAADPTRPAAAPDGEGTTLSIGRQVAAVVVLAAIATVSVLFLPPIVAGGVMIGVAILYLGRKAIFSFTGGLVILVAIIMFIPVRRWSLPIPLDFALEPYRVILVLLVLVILGALLVDKKRTWQPVAFGWPIGIFFASLVISIPMNGTELVQQGLASDAVGAVVNYAILLSTFYVVRQLLTKETIVMGLVTGLVWCGTLVAFFAIVERATRVNIFLRLDSFLPLIALREEGEAFRAGGYRSYGSAQHPIALSVMLCMLIPLAIYLAKYGKWPRNELSRRILYGIATVFLLGGVLSAVSRTAVIVLAVMFILTLILRPWLGLLLLAFGLPALVIGFLAVPKVFDTLLLSFLDVDGLIASQQTSPGFRGAGRLADLGPSLALYVMRPFFGTGVGSRIVVGDDQNAYILDNQILGSMLETGAVGVIGVAALTLIPLIMILRWTVTVAKHDPRFGFLGFAIVVSGAGYTAALFFYDAFGFYQTFFVLCILFAIGAWLITSSPPALRARAEREAGTLAVERVAA